MNDGELFAAFCFGFLASQYKRRKAVLFRQAFVSRDEYDYHSCHSGNRLLASKQSDYQLEFSVA